MSELLEMAKALAQWPIAEGFFVIVISFLGFTTYRKGERDRRTLGHNAVEIPMFLLSGPLHDTMDSVQEMSEQSRVSNRLLEEILDEVRAQNRILEKINGSRSR